MSLIPADHATQGWPGWLRRALLCALALALVAGCLSLLAFAIASWSPPVRPPARNPFGAALPREALPSTTGIGAVLIAWQSSFYRELTATLKAIAQVPAAIWGLLGLSFGYGVFHAAGPGHGKAVISGYIVADNRSLRRGLSLSFAAAMLQALVAIAIVSVATLIFRTTAAQMNMATSAIEQGSFLLVALVGLLVLWRKAGSFLALGQGGAAHEAACDHVHLPDAQEIARLRDWRDMAGVVLAAGLRPCAGALIILVFAASQGLYWAGIAAAFAMALGTAITTGALAALAVFFKFAALKFASGGSLRAMRLLAGLELLAAAFIVTLGVALSLGLWIGGMGS
ncbi:nickel transporter [Bosea sp. (in: a-proteobacteria)]|uniref:nickel/cobalt transporter n=1 Tax=Bosea sp. (in: a-proteobacteria) TaxID=1871050 RepID=UPI001AD25A47|nr:nickel transporter [Bosea sp. (in: a-proteobacteria)]MBN9443270.1 nickel transporter [Bosea sp. (in: a-proteobacteria)]